MKKCAISSHTADIRVKIFAKTKEDLFINAAVCLFKLLTDRKPKIQNKKSIELTALSIDDLLIFWLNELISIFYSYKFLPANYKVYIKEVQGKVKLTAMINGQDFNPYSSDDVKTEIKAATYHNLKIKKEKNVFSAEVIFDV